MRNHLSKENRPGTLLHTKESLGRVLKIFFLRLFFHNEHRKTSNFKFGGTLVEKH
jgi:hypothetical protein